MTLVPAQNFYELRREGIQHIVDTGHDQWTDYNTHDPGITMLEALAFAITELSYRTGFPIEDILASAVGPDGDPYHDQAFYTARQILTVNPVTTDDLRRLLIDVDPVRNAWVSGKACDCACDAPFYAWCDDGQLVLSHDPAERPATATAAVPITPCGLYDVVLELESDPGLGDLNDRKVAQRRTFVAEGRLHPLTVEVRFPSWPLTARDERSAFTAGTGPLSVAVDHLWISPRHKPGDPPVTDLQKHWSDVLYVDFQMTLDDGTVITLRNATVRLFGDDALRRTVPPEDVLAWLRDHTTDGFAQPYRGKLSTTDRAIAAAKAVLAAHRSLDEDICHVDLVTIDEIGVCAEVEVDPTADIDRIQAEIWFRLERHLDRPVAFWSVEELRNRGTPVEDIFNGPELDNGFVTAEDLADTDLRRQLRVSDILNELADIDGIISIDHLLLTAYDPMGNPVPGRADDRRNPDQVSASWVLSMPSGRRPRLHRQLSRFLFSSNGLPFRARLDEAEDILVELHGKAARPKLRAADLDLARPPGRARQMDTYFPVQHSFPLVYGIGPAGLPSTAKAERRAQAKQLQGYLLVFEQILRNAYAQVAHVGDLFSLDPKVERTYFGQRFTSADIAAVYDIVDSALTDDAFNQLLESEAGRRQRRNLFLDHLLARFGENLADQAMALINLEGQTQAAGDLIAHKLALLRELPQLGHDRARAFNRSVAPCAPDNEAGLKERINLILGLPRRTFAYRATRAGHELVLTEAGGTAEHLALGPAADAALQALVVHLALDTVHGDWSIDGVAGQLTLSRTAAGQTTSEDLVGFGPSEAAAQLSHQLVQAQRQLLRELTLVADPGTAGGTATAADITTATWAAHQRAIIVEHLLLRPKFPGDALYPACSDGPCCTCDDDPYSFRLTYVMPGWTAPFSTNIEMRRFAERTIQEQTPAHLLGKICWVGDEGRPDRCDLVIDAIAAILTGDGAKAEAACECAAQIYERYRAAFQEWFTQSRLSPAASPVTLADITDVVSRVNMGEVPCAPANPGARASIVATLADRFLEIATGGFQFERFEEAWCGWADADAAIDWTGERLQESVLELLERSLAAGADHQTVCTCAATMLARFGTQFRNWIGGEIAAGRTPAVDAIPEPDVSLCDGLTFADEDATRTAVAELLTTRYRRYVDVSYRLHLLVNELAELRNTYPQATLHDCDVGSDFNPVRLGQTALGSNA